MTEHEAAVVENLRKLADEFALGARVGGLRDQAVTAMRDAANMIEKLAAARERAPNGR